MVLVNIRQWAAAQHLAVINHFGAETMGVTIT
jgi:hypothetical protein